MGLDTSGVVPVYYQLKELLRQEIASGAYTPGSQIPSEHDLMRQFSVSRATVRQALGDLVTEGLLVKRQGKGSFVADPKIVEDLTGMDSFRRQMDQRGMRTSIKLLAQYWLPASYRERELFALQSDERVFRVLRQISVQDEPIFIESYEIPERHCPGLLELDLSVFFAEIVFGHYKLNINRVVKYIEPALADDFEAKTLGIKKASPVMLVERISYPPGDSAALLTTKWIVRGDRCRHVVRVG